MLPKRLSPAVKTFRHQRRFGNKKLPKRLPPSCCRNVLCRNVRNPGYVNIFGHIVDGTFGRHYCRRNGLKLLSPKWLVTKRPCPLTSAIREQCESDHSAYSVLPVAKPVSFSSFTALERQGQDVILTDVLKNLIKAVKCGCRKAFFIWPHC